MSKQSELLEMKILLVEDNPGDARLLQEELMADADGLFQLTRAEDLHTALRLLPGQPEQDLGQTSFEAMLLDLNLPDSQGLDTFHAIHATAPWLPVVVLTGMQDEGTGLRAVQEGAQDYLVKGEASGAVVARSLRYAVERNRSLQWHRDKSRHATGGRIISFLGVKGGVGTTTLALNTAAVLAQDKLVIAAELRADYGSFASHFRKLTGPNLSALYRMEEAELSDALLEQRLINSQLGFYLMFGPQSVGEFHEVHAGHAGKMLQLLARMGDFVIVDLPPAPDAAQEVVIRRSNAVVLVSERDDSSLQAAQMTIGRLNRLGVSSDALSVVVVSRSVLVDAYPAEKIETMLGVRVLGIVPPAPDVCAASQKAGAPVVLYRPRSAPANMLTSLAQRAAAIAVGTPAAVAAH